MEAKTCFSCQFAGMAKREDPATKKTVIDIHFRICQRFPPNVFIAPGPKGPYERYAWPVVDSSAWCGEFKSRHGVEALLPGENKPDDADKSEKPS